MIWEVQRDSVSYPKIFDPGIAIGGDRMRLCQTCRDPLQYIQESLYSGTVQ